MTLLAPTLARQIEAMNLDEFSDLWGGLSSPEARAQVLYARCRTDRRLFARTFFAERFDLDWSPVQEAFLAEQIPPWRERTHQSRRRWVAPRGSAKSSVKSFLEPLHDVLYGREVCIHVYSTGYRLAESLVKDLHAVLSDPSPLLKSVFGEVEITGSQTNFVAHVAGGEVLGTAVVAMSFGGDARGYKHAGKRPSKFILDDTVNPKHIKNPDQRAAQWSFLQKDIGRAGWSYSAYELVGTIQHPDDLVARLLRAPDWTGRIWRNLIAWPARMDLWEKCRLLWADLTSPDRMAQARAFYEANRAEMDLGAQVLWPQGRSLWELMLTWWASPSAFYSEDQNNPRDSEAALFDLEKIRRCRYDRAAAAITTSQGRIVPLSACRIAIWLDPSGGSQKARRSDYPAIAVLALWKPPESSASASTGVCFVLTVEITRRQPTGQHEALWRHWERLAAFRPKVGADETGTQHLLGEAFTRIQEERRRRGLAWQMPVQTYTLSEEKTGRIASLEPGLHNGWIELADDLPGEVLDQIRDFPNAAFDDALDAIERAHWLLTGATPHVDSYSRG